MLRSPQTQERFASAMHSGIQHFFKVNPHLASVG
jgi:N-acetylmuramoyl-L-alanine amidase